MRQSAVSVFGDSQPRIICLFYIQLLILFFSLSLNPMHPFLQKIKIKKRTVSILKGIKSVEPTRHFRVFCHIYNELCTLYFVLYCWPFSTTGVTFFLVFLPFFQLRVMILMFDVFVRKRKFTFSLTLPERSVLAYNSKMIREYHSRRDVQVHVVFIFVLRKWVRCQLSCLEEKH